MRIEASRRRPDPGRQQAIATPGLPLARLQGRHRHLGQTRGQILQAAPVVFAVDQRQPAGAAPLHLGQQPAAGQQAQ